MTFIQRNISILISGLMILLLALNGCSDDPASTDPDDGALEDAANSIAVVLESQQQEMIYVSMAPMDRYITFCYADGECESTTAGGSGVGGEGSTFRVEISDSERTVVGISAKVEVPDDSEGRGLLFVAELDDDNDPSGIEYYRTDVFEAGDVIEFELGEVSE